MQLKNALSLLSIIIIPVLTSASPQDETISGLTIPEISEANIYSDDCAYLIMTWEDGDKITPSHWVDGCEKAINLARNRGEIPELPPTKEAISIPESCPNELGYISTNDISGYTLGSICHWNKEHLSTSIFEVHPISPDRELYSGGEKNVSGIISNIINNIKEAEIFTRSQAAYSASMQSRKHEEDTYFEIIIDPYSDSISSYGVATQITRNFCGADSANSLSPGNSFRIALEQKYGNPQKTITASSLAKEIDQEIISTKKEITRLKKERPIEAIQLESGMNAFVIPKRDYYRSLGSTVSALEWKNDTHETVYIEQIEDNNHCSGKPFFHLKLSNKPYKQKISSQIETSMQEAKISHGKNAAVPNF